MQRGVDSHAVHTYASGARLTRDVGPSAEIQLHFPDLHRWPVENFREIGPITSRINQAEGLDTGIIKKQKQTI